MGWESGLKAEAFVFPSLLLLLLLLSWSCHGGAGEDEGKGIPTTLEGPFNPVTILLDLSFSGNVMDLPPSDPRLRKEALGLHPEQISVSLSSSHHSVWISWITGDYQIGDTINPLNPKTVDSIVRYGRLRASLTRSASGDSCWSPAHIG